MLLKFIKPLLSMGVLLGAFVYVSEQTDWLPILTAFSKMPWSFIALATFALIFGALLASLRLQWIAADLGYRLSFRDSVSALSVGQVMGALFFQLAGQLIARSTLLSRRQIPTSGTIVITGYERFAALAVSLAFALAAAIYLFGSISIDITQGGSSFIKLAAGVLVAAAGGAALAWGGALRANFPALLPGTYYKLARNVGLSIAIQLSTMAAYVLLAHALAPQIAIAKLVAASALVMLAASLPISLAGWGIREMSAIFVLGAIGVPAEASLTVAVTIGVLSLAVVGAMTLSAVGHSQRQPVASHDAVRPAFDYGALLDYALPLIAASAVFFQVFVPLNKGMISANLAEPAVILGGSLFVVRHFGRQWPAWRLRSFSLWVGLATMAFVAAYLHGLVTLGWTDWAFANRLIGWPILLCYGATGALIVRHHHGQGFKLLLRTFVAVALAIVVFDVAITFAYQVGGTWLKPGVAFPLAGFSQNRNTFAFQLLMAIGVLFATQWREKALWLGILIAGVVLSGSRAAFVSLAVLTCAAGFVAPFSFRTAAAAAALAGAIVAMIFVAPEWIDQAINGVFPSGDVMDQLMSGDSSDMERLKSMIGGWDMFVSHPIFGAGLGAFIEQQTQAGTPLVIHSTPLWLLAELGIVGFAIMVAPIVLIFRKEISALKTADSAGKLLILIITAFAVMSLVHEVMFQRAFWLLLGACLARVPAVDAAQHDLNLPQGVRAG